ncbi:DUF4270 domain-containing protein [Pedobacter sp. V48]|uniref:DUF4270 domain-containing protein n=1 Tax=Pedobacter sp. V48 TaxID=509635 RepID=UPI0003E598AA|nr:DUF4270 domain-containing protein [Pedobacter sp. V48]ETZ19786.1 hypothetical protein N824_09955 [Pedobacter sp. V48]
MKFIKLDLLTLLIGLFLFASCKDANTIGLTPDGDSPIKGILDNTVLVDSKTVLDSATASIGLARHPLGYTTGDATFGTTEASLSMTVSLPSTSYSFGGIPTVDSAILVLPYSTQFYGDTTTSVYSLNVHQLKDDLSLQKVFLSNKVWPVETEVVGSITTKIKPKTPFKITDIVKGKPDTLKAVAPQLRIKLSNTFIQEHILNVDSAQRATNTKFSAVFKGLQVSVNKTSSSGPGGVMFINFGGTDANLQIYYKKQVGTSVVEKDTVAVNFPISSSSGPIAATVKHDYTGTPVKAQLDAPTASFDVTYLQALSGVRNKISFPDLKAFVDKVKAGNADARVVINRAELVVNLKSGTDVSPWNAAQRLSLYRLDIAGQRANIPDNEGPTQANPNPPATYAGSEAAFGGFYDTTNKRYIFTVTSYLQALIDNKTVDYGTYLAPSSLTEYNVFPSLTSGARSIINTATPATGEKGIKLNIYYNIVD